MPPRLATLIELLHSVPRASLATHCVSLPGYPFASDVAFAPDERHCPVVLMSRLAEHRRNLQRDSRASLMVTRSVGQGEIARATLIGDIVPVPPSHTWTQRYLRYQPHAQRLLALGDFEFFRLDAVRMQVIGGFAQAGWIEGSALNGLAHFTPDEEAGLVERLAPALSEGWTVIGIDAYGADLLLRGRRERLAFRNGASRAEAAAEAFAAAMREREVSGAGGGTDSAG